MRITNKIMQDNALSNINQNKVLQDKLSTQMASGKKIMRPSDDPVIAIRALRLRSTLSDVKQYHDKNVEDAESWLELTESAIVSVNNVLTDMYDQCVKGSNSDLNTEAREAILEALRELKNEIYATGDADYAGRGLFTGYRTSTKLRFEGDEKLQYSITEKIDKALMDDITYVKMDNGKNSIGEINAGNYNDAGGEYAFQDTEVYPQTVHRIRLSYSGLDANVVPNLSYYSGPVNGPGTLQTIPVTVISKYGQVIGNAGGDIEMGNPGDTVKVEKGDPYLMTMEGPKLSATGDVERDPGTGDVIMETKPITGAVFIPETGELILDDATYKALSSVRDYQSTEGVDEGKISVTYSKTDWKEGDLKPQHYFECVEDPLGKNIKHNMETAKGAKDQVIAYDVGFNQEVRVNTLASEVYTHSIGRDVDDLIGMLEQVGDVEAAVATLEGIVKDEKTSNADRIAAEKNLEAANKALTLLKEKMQVSFEGAITKMQNHQKDTTLALTNVGTRSSKLALVKNRLADQKTNFKDLVADNEQADTAEVATDLASAKLAYDTSLMATGKITESTLMNFI